MEKLARGKKVKGDCTTIMSASSPLFVVCRGKNEAIVPARLFRAYNIPGRQIILFLLFQRGKEREAEGLARPLESSTALAPVQLN